MQSASKRLVLVQIFLIFILPVLLLYFGIFSMDWRMVFLALSALAIYGIIRHEHWIHEDMGLRYDNFKKALPFYLLSTASGIVVLFLLHSKVNFSAENYTSGFFLQTFIFFLPSSFFQEFAFRSFLIPRLKIIFKNDYYIIFVNALLFTFMHVIYPSLSLVLPLVFALGIFFAWLYIKYPNLVLISIAHSVLNVVAVLLGFFGLPS